MNSIYLKLLTSKIEAFIKDFHSSKDIFEDITKRNKLIHAGEFGMYRERICNELIQFTIPSKYKIDTGFLLNSNDEVSSQCDIVVYDSNNTPFIQNGYENRFFPVEPIIAIGEIKSKLSIASLGDACVKLARNKRIKQVNKVFCVNNGNKGSFQPNIDCHDTLFSFIICEEIESFHPDKAMRSLNKMYEENDLEYEYRHNVILSIKDGILGYKNQFTDLPNEIPTGQFMYMPSFLKKDFENMHYNKGAIKNMIYLLSSLSNFSMNVNIYYPEPSSYT